MLIDWFTVIAQIINFLILVWLMKKFLYKPILRTIDRREKRIADQLAEAAGNREEAERLTVELRQKREIFDQEYASRVEEMNREIQTIREEHLSVVRNETTLLKKQQSHTIERESIEFENSFRQELGRTVTAIASKLMLDLADEAIEDKMINVFLARLSDPGMKPDRHQLDDLKKHPRIVVTSAYELSPGQRSRIETALTEWLASPHKIDFEHEPNLICGIEVWFGGYKAAWNIADYLQTLKKTVESSGVRFPEQNGADPIGTKKP